jgi:hypothetical protein
MGDELVRLVSRLEDEGQKTCVFFRELQPQDWDKQVYSEGARWRVHQVLAHFVEAEASVARLIAHVVSGGPGVPEDFDLNAYNDRKVARLDEQTPADLIDRFAELRALTIAMVGGFGPGDLEKTGRHPFLGVARVADMLKLMYRHNQIHQRDLRRLLRAGS